MKAEGSTESRRRQLAKKVDYEYVVMEPAGGIGSRRHQTAFARMLVLVLPGSLLLTWLWKQQELNSHSSRFSPSLFDGFAPRAVDNSPYVAGGATLDWAESRRDGTRAARAPLVHIYTPPERVDEAVEQRLEQRCTAEEMTALIQVVDALGGQGWRESGGGSGAWPVGGDCCSWKGVGCEAGRVRKLELSGASLRGTLPSQLSQLRELRSLDLNDNPQLGGSLPAQWISLQSLTHIYLFGTRISGVIPPELPPRLHELEASHCRLSGSLPSQIRRLSSLQYIFLESNQLSGTLPRALGELRQLRELELSENLLSGSVPTELASLHLDHFDIQKTKLTGKLTTAPKSQCSGGGDKYLRGAAAGTSRLNPK